MSRKQQSCKTMDSVLGDGDMPVHLSALTSTTPYYIVIEAMACDCLLFYAVANVAGISN